MTDKYLTVEEALRGWLNGETLQVQNIETPRRPSCAWRTCPPISETESLWINTQKFRYRFKPKQTTVWVVLDHMGYPVNAFKNEFDASTVAKYQAGRRVVRMVEQPE